MLEALWDNPALWQSTAVFINYDENDGFFDHVLPPFAAGRARPASTSQELPIGLGPRVPMLVVSPWSRGGWVNSQVFDHTSVLRFLEALTGVAEPNISRLAPLGLRRPDQLLRLHLLRPERAGAARHRQAARARPMPSASCPHRRAPGAGAQPAPVVETGTRKHRAAALPAQRHA